MALTVTPRFAGIYTVATFSADADGTLFTVAADEMATIMCGMVSHAGAAVQTLTVTDTADVVLTTFRVPTASSHIFYSGGRDIPFIATSKGRGLKLVRSAETWVGNITYRVTKA